MSGTLALVGGAEWTAGCDFDADLLVASGDTRVTVLPTAAAFERSDLVVDRATVYFAELGADVEVVDVLGRQDALKPERVAQIEASSFIYLAGGSPMHLRSALLGTALWEAVVRRWRDGAVLAAAGESAAALSTHMVDPRGGAFTVGLDLLHSLTVVPRWSDWSEDKWHRTVKLAPSGMAVVGIDEATAIIHTDEAGWTVSGAGSVTVRVDGHLTDISALETLSSR